MDEPLYAVDTKVPVARTRDEIERLLKRHGKGDQRGHNGHLPEGRHATCWEAWA
jgi:hypothetical protein